MQIIPVIDFKQGLVVHAKQGDRDDYKPLKSRLTQSSDIFDVLDAFLTLYRFSTFYIADLDAITHQSDNGNLIYKVLRYFPDILFWVDSGYPLYSNKFRQLTNYLPVLGSESFQDNNTDEIKHFNNRFILSLDYSKTGKMGAKALFSNEMLWPEQVIIMNLPRVGSNLGPDVEQLTAYCKQYPEKKIIAAGGIRNCTDLKALQCIGVDQALVASALHNGNLSAAEITNIQTKKYPD
jgi:phosphoribosylformimino-5-aminoimidazole carboxamide ribotide isomerase